MGLDKIEDNFFWYLFLFLFLKVIFIIFLINFVKNKCLGLVIVGMIKWEFFFFVFLRIVLNWFWICVNFLVIYFNGSFFIFFKIDFWLIGRLFFVKKVFFVFNLVGWMLKIYFYVLVICLELVMFKLF